MKKTICGILLLAVIFSCFICLGAVAAGKVPQQVSLTVNNKIALVDSSKVVLETPPVIVSDRTLVPLRFVGEAFGSSFYWNSSQKQVTMVQGQTNVKLWIGKNQVEVSGHMQKSDIAPLVIQGRTMVPLRLISEAMGFEVVYQSKNKTINISRANNPPEAKFKMDKEFACVGEQVSYQDLSFDPDGDDIVDRVWINNNTFFETPGIFKVALKVKDSRGVWSDWHEETIEISNQPNVNPVAQFSVENNKVFVGQPVLYQDLSFDPDGDEIVDWVWENRQESFSVPGVYQVGLTVKDRKGAWSRQFVQFIEVVEKPNEPPVAHFSVTKTRVAQGETVEFKDESFDPDGDQLLEWKWEGKKRAFFQPGTFPVSLMVKDGRGKWSDSYTVEITVTDEVLMTELEYNLHNPIQGETVNLGKTNPLTFPVLKPAAQSTDDTVLLISNCPETVKENGILYRDTANGSIRLMYHHKNGTETKKRVYVLAENTEDRPVTIIMKKKGWGGPSVDDLGIGQKGLARYLMSTMNERTVIEPGQIIALDGSGSGREIKSGNSIFGMMDLEASGNVMFTFVMVDAGSDVFNDLTSLEVLERDMHQRGTFYGANRMFHLKVDSTDPQRFNFCDNKTDYNLGGIDATTGEQVINRGNYGLAYTVRIDAARRIGVLTNPRGGVFMGAAINSEGQAYGLPDTGLIKNGSQAVLNMIMQAGEEEEFLFVPPVSSTMPVSLLFVPF